MTKSFPSRRHSCSQDSAPVAKKSSDSQVPARRNLSQQVATIHRYHRSLELATSQYLSAHLHSYYNSGRKVENRRAFDAYWQRYLHCLSRLPHFVQPGAGTMRALFARSSRKI
jgi:hypothetical protein